MTLVPEVWPQTATMTDGVLHLGGIDVRDLAAEHGRGLRLQQRVQRLQDGFAGRGH